MTRASGQSKNLESTDHNGACASGRTSRLHFAFLKQSELLAKEQVLGNDGGMGETNNRMGVNNPTFYKSLQILPTDKMKARI
jgi:hypothetical protein